MGVDANDYDSLGKVVGMIVKKSTALGLTLGGRKSVTPSLNLFYLLLVQSS